MLALHKADEQEMEMIEYNLSLTPRVFMQGVAWKGVSAYSSIEYTDNVLAAAIRPFAERMSIW